MGAELSRSQHSIRVGTTKATLPLQNGLAAPLIQIWSCWSGQAFALCSHGGLDVIRSDRAAFAVVLKHSLTGNEAPAQLRFVRHCRVAGMVHTSRVLPLQCERWRLEPLLTRK